MLTITLPRMLRSDKTHSPIRKLQGKERDEIKKMKRNYSTTSNSTQGCYTCGFGC